MADVRVVGREPELAALRAFLADDAPDRALVLAGAPGAGKTTLWEAALGAARERSLRVLTARPRDTEAQHSFLGLADLLDGVDSGALDGLPAPQRRALDIALLRAEPAGDPPPPTAISVGFLNALRSLADGQPVLVAIDDVQWLDAASAEAVAFAVRRLDDRPVRFLLAKRTGGTSLLEQAHGPVGLQRLEVGPLTLGATRRLLADRLDLSLTRHVLRRVVDSTLGNPLFALELGRLLAARGPLELGEEMPLPDTVEELLGTRVAGLPAPVRRLVLAVALAGELPGSQVAAIGTPAALDDAVAAGVLVIDRDRVRPAHPLFAAAARSAARPGEQRELHLALAELAGDEESRALHLALAADGPDAELAAAVADAAAVAAAHGARRDAVVLAEHALRLTPPVSTERHERVLALGGYLETAGELQRMDELLLPALDSLPSGPLRARAWLLLAEGGGVRSVGDYHRHLEQALAESGGDPGLRAYALAKLADIGLERVDEAEAAALEALEAAPFAGPEVELLALYGLGWARALGGRPLDDVIERFRAVSDAASYMARSPERVAAQRLVWRGELEAARAELTRLLAVADEHGEPISYALQRLHLCELELRAGAWQAAERLLDEWAESADRELLVPPMYERCRALAAAGRGLPEDAARWAAEAIERAEASGVDWDRLEALRARGTAELLTHEPARAAESLRAAWDHTVREGVAEPGVFPVAPELVEALVELGERDEAAAVGRRLHEVSVEQDHPWGLATARRCDALVRLAGGSYDEEAAGALAQAAGAYGELGLPFDRARTLLGLGRAQRRWKKWGAARASLESAAASFDELGSSGWAEQARSELARVGARRPQRAGELTPAERRVVELAADGLANKEIARSLFVTVRTVEVHLTHAYAKLGVRSRSQLARRLSEPT